MNDFSGETFGLVGDQQVLPRLRFDSLGPEGRGDDRKTRGECLENLQPRAGSCSNRNGHHGMALVERFDSRHLADKLDSFAIRAATRSVRRMTADHGQHGVGAAAADGGPDFRYQKLEPILVWQILEVADEQNPSAFCSVRVRRESSAATPFGATLSRRHPSDM
jgi:hypothetical protein